MMKKFGIIIIAFILIVVVVLVAGCVTETKQWGTEVPQNTTIDYVTGKVVTPGDTPSSTITTSPTKPPAVPKCTTKTCEDLWKNGAISGDGIWKMKEFDLTVAGTLYTQPSGHWYVVGEDGMVPMGGSPRSPKPDWLDVRKCRY